MVRILTGLFIALLALSSLALGQGVFPAYSQNFDASSSLPAAFTADAGAGTWTIATTTGSSGYTGASGLNHVILTNNAAVATLNLTLNANISTVGYTGITVIWGARRTGTFTETVTFAWSIDGSTWTPAAYTEVASNSTWALINAGVAISLPAGAEGAANLRLRWTATQLSNSGTYRVDDILVKGTRALQNGDGTAVVTNAFGSGVLNNTLIFPKAAAAQSALITVTGNAAGTLTKVSVAVPYQWTWTGSPSDVALTGDGASLTNRVISGAGTNGNPYVITYDGAITNAAIAKITLSNLTTPNTASLVTDNGNYAFVVSTAIAAGTLTSIASSPAGYVIVPMANVRNQTAGVPVFANNTVAVEGVATEGNAFSATNLQAYFQDATGGLNLFYSSTGVTITEGKDYIAKGLIQQFNGNTEVVVAATSDIIDNGVSTLPSPLVVTVAQILASPETYEGRYIAVQNLTRTTTAWPVATGTAGTSTSMVFSDGTNSMNILVDNDTDVDGNAEPAWPKDIKGIFYQSAAAPTYVLAPRFFAQDIVAANSLPVELSSFTSAVRGSNVELSWSTATEANNYGFDVERTPAGTQSWSKVSFVSGNGTSNVAHNYAYADNVSMGKYSYRLKQIDRDGKFQYSATVEATVGMTPNTMILGQNYPNPFNPETKIEFAVPATGFTTLKVYNMLGAEVSTLVNGTVEAGVLNQVSFKGSTFPSGMYFYTLRSGSFVDTKKMLMVK